MSRFVLTAQLQLRAPTNTSQVLNQIKNQLSGVTVPVTVTGAQQAQRQLSGVTNQTNQATSAAQRMGGAFGVAVKRFLAFSIAARGISLVTQGLSEATKEAIAFQREMIKISQVTGKTIAQLKGLESTITRLSTGLGVSSKDLLGVSRILAQAGIQAKNLEVALEALAKTTLAPTFDDIAKTAEGAVAILAQFQRGVGALEEQLGAINAVAGQFAVESGDLIAAIRRTGGVFKAAGGDLNELLGLFTAIRATTRESAESIATGLRTILTRIQRPTTIKYLENLGISLVDLNGKFVGPFEAIKRLSGALSGLEEGDLKFVEIAEQLGGFRQIGKVIPLLQQFETAEKARQAALAGGDSLTKDAAAAQAALAVQITKVKEEFLALIRNIANTTSFQAFVKTALNLASALIKIGEAIKPLLPLLTTLGTMAALRGLGGFARGIGGGMAARNHGGKIYGFARGGSVPGVGNRDTVPAMLQPGEFVIRKSSVDKLGTGTLQAMNENRFNRGVRVRGSDLQKQLTQKGGITAGKEYKAKDSTLKGTFQLAERLDDAALDGIAKSDSTYGGVFLRPIARDQVIQGKFSEGAMTKAIQGSKSFKEAELIAKAESKNPEFSGLLAKVQSEKKKLASKASKMTGYTLMAGSLERKQAENMESIILAGVRNTISRTTRQIGGMMQFRSAPDQAKIMKSTNIDNVVGNIFEAALIAGGAPYDNTKGLSNAAFDFPDGMSTLASRFGLGRISNKPTDAKSTFSTDNIATFEKKIYNYEKPRMTKQIDAAIAGIVASLKGVAAADRAAKMGMAAGKGGNLQKFQQSTKLIPTVKKNSGGSISGKDTVPALLTPGEFVVNKKSAQSIGYGNLASMNNTGVARFNTGGVVGGVQKFANGGMAAGSVSFRGLDTVSAKSTALVQALTKMGASINGTNMVVQKFHTALMSGATNAKALEIAFRGTNVQVSNNAAAQSKNTAETNKNTAAQTKNSKASGGMMMGMMSLSMVLGMFAPTIDENSSSMKKLGAELVSMSMTLAMVIMALDMFGMKLNAQALLGQGGGVFGRRAGAKVSRGIKRMPGMGGSLGKGLGKAAGKLTNIFSKLLGPIALFAGAMFAITKIMDAYSGVHEKAKKAIEEGNVAAAGQASLDSANQKAANKLAMGTAAAGAAIGSAFGPIGTVVGGLVGGLGGLWLKTEEGQKALDNFRNIAMGQFLGFDTSATVRAYAEADAALNRYTKNLDENNKKVSEVFTDLQNGVITLEEAMTDPALNRNMNNAMEAQRKAEKARDSRLDQGFSVGREIGSYFGMDSNQAQFDANDKRVAEAKKASKEAVSATLGDLGKLSGTFIKQSAGQGSFEDFLNQRGLDEQTIRESGNSEELEKLRRRFQNMREATLRQIEAVKALNFGLRDVRATSAVFLQSLSDVDKRAETGANQFSRAASILELGLTEAAAKLSPKKFAEAVDTLGESMIDLGASPEQVTKAKQTLKDLNTVQRGAGKALENVKKKMEAGADPPEIQQALKDELLNLLPEGSDTRKILEKQLAANGKNLSDAAQVALRKGDYDGFLKEVLGDSFGAAGEQIIQLAKARAEAETDLIKTIYDRRKAEDSLVKAQQEAINVQIEAAKIIAEFGGAQFTPEQQNLANINKFNLAANQAGVGGLASGSASDINRVSQGIFKQFQEQERVQQNAFRGDGPGFQGREGADADNRQRLLEANKQLLTFARERIKGYKEELEIVRAKNRAEKDALDKLVGGDITGFIQGQIAASAGSALRTGDAGLANLFSASALGAGFKTLEGQKLDDRTRKRAAGLTLGAVGINDQRSAGVLAGATAEEENIKGLIRETASAMAGVAQSFADMKELQVETQNVRIVAKEKVFSEASTAFSNAMQQINNPAVETGKQLAEVALQAGSTVANFVGLGEGFDKLEAKIRSIAGLPPGAGNPTKPTKSKPTMASGGVVSYKDPNNPEVVSHEDKEKAFLGYKARGGVVYANAGMFIPRGTDTVPAMLTPGEFVVNRRAVNTGNNLQVLTAMNDGVATASNSGYNHRGGRRGGGSMPNFDSFSQALNNFNTALAENISRLEQHKFIVKLDPTNVNVNLNGASFLASLKDDIKTELLQEVGNQITQYKPKEGGGLGYSERVLA